MTHQERTHWDNIYRQQQGNRDYPAPDPLLFEFVPPILENRPHRALDLACGYGQNALWMASQGYVTDAIDISRVALAVAQVRAAKQNIRQINILPLDLDSAQLEKNHYDVITVVRFIKRGLIPDIRAAIRPGGRIIYQAYNTHYLHTDPHYDPEQLIRIGELVGYFADWRIVHNSTVKGVSQIVAIKPQAKEHD